MYTTKPNLLDYDILVHHEGIHLQMGTYTDMVTTNYSYNIVILCYTHLNYILGAYA